VQSRYYLAMREIIAEENLDALSLRCWSELPNITGQWAYLALVRLVSENIPATMEGDADGALTCLIGESLGMGQGFLSDWLEHDDETVTLWHPGNAPFSLAPAIGEKGGPRLAGHFNISKPTVVESVLPADMELTLFRLWRVGEEYRACCVEGITRPVDEPLSGTHGLFVPDGGHVYDRFESWLHTGFPHHIAVFPGRHGRRLQRLLRLFDISILQ
jgi:L-fucose isomerase-like protein